MKWRRQRGEREEGDGVGGGGEGRRRNGGKEGGIISPEADVAYSRWR